MTQEQERREDDQFLRKAIKFQLWVIGVFSVAFVAGVASYIFLVASIAKQVENNTDAISVLQKQHEAINVLTSTLTGVNVNIQNLQRGVESIDKKMDSNTEKLNKFAPIVDRADRYIDEHIKDHQRRGK